MKIMTADEARKKVQAGQAVIVDVRDKDEVSIKEVSGALNIPLSKLSEHIHELPKDKEILFLCQSGRRSSQACEQVLEHIPGARSIEGGLAAWEKSGGTVLLKSRNIPIMRQVQIAAGSLILVGFFIKPLWLLVPLVGAGLTFAGLSGTCAMATILSKMPWNKNLNGGVTCQS
ncbi:MAG: rhodanese-like domain-containing protein [Deltaproteobacteria bacterium]|nr:MAG: rhodanese-like domain-containing protein [Deltaproteobacteria bacterium]